MNYNEFRLISIQEADFALNFVRPESLSGDPVTLGPVFGPGDVNIISKKIDSRIKYGQVTDAVFNFSHLLYYHIVVAFLIILTLLVFTHSTQKHYTLYGISRNYRYYTKYCYRSYALILHQVNMVPIRWSQKIIWIFFSVSTYVLVDCYFLNLMSTDQLSVVTADQIDSANDLMLARWSRVKPSITTHFYLYPLLRSAPPGSECHTFYNFLQKRGDSFSTVAENGKHTEKAGFMLKIIIKALEVGSEAIFFPELFYETIAKSALCALKPQVVVNMAHIAKENFAKGTLNLIFNSKMNAQKRSYLHFKYQNIVEFGVCKQILKHMALETTSALNMPAYHEFQKCMSDQFDASDVEPVPLNIYRLTDTYIICMFGVIVSLMARLAEFSVEHLLKKQSKHMKFIIRTKLTKVLVSMCWLKDMLGFCYFKARHYGVNMGKIMPSIMRKLARKRAINTRTIPFT